MTITIEQLQAQHSELAALIEKFKAQQQTKLLVVREAHIEMRHGERYAGVVFDEDGLASHHVILLPGEAEDVSWSAAVEWAEKAGGALPTRQEQALLYANLKSEFKPEWYWSGEEHENGSYAWAQYFDSGFQYGYHKSRELRARAVRRFTA